METKIIPAADALAGQMWAPTEPSKLTGSVQLVSVDENGKFTGHQILVDKNSVKLLPDLQKEIINWEVVVVPRTTTDGRESNLYILRYHPTISLVKGVVFKF